MEFRFGKNLSTGAIPQVILKHTILGNSNTVNYSRNDIYTYRGGTHHPIMIHQIGISADNALFQCHHKVLVWIRIKQLEKS